MKNLVTENKDINKSVSLRLNKSLLEEINKIFVMLLKKK